jgi:hypothetical protein
MEQRPAPIACVPKGVPSYPVNLSHPGSPSVRLIRALDVALVLWIGAWIAIAVMLGLRVRGLADLSDTITDAGRSVLVGARELKALREIPIIGPELADVGASLERAGTETVERGRGTRRDIESLSFLLTIAVGIAPTVPLLSLYLPLRWARIQEVRTIRRAMDESRDDPSLEEFLARRAAENLPFDVLRRISANPWRDMEEGRFGPLAEAELHRLGIRRRGGPFPSALPSGNPR